MRLLLSLGRLTWSSVIHTGLLRFLSGNRIKREFEQIENVFFGNGYPEEVIVDTMKKTVDKFRNNIAPFDPPKCPVYVRLPWIGSPSQLIADKVSSSGKCFFFHVAMARTIFTNRAAFLPTHKSVLPIFQLSNLIYKYQLSNLIYKFQCFCNATYIGRTSQRFRLGVSSMFPHNIRTFKIARFDHLQAFESYK